MRIQKMAAYVLALMLLAAHILLVPAAYGADGGYAWVDGPTSAKAGETFTVTVGFQSDTPVTGVQMQISYDTSLLTLTGSSQIDATAFDSTSGMAVGDWANTVRSATLVRLTFRMSASAASGQAAQISVGGAFGSTEDFEKISLSADTLSVTVPTPAPDPTPSKTGRLSSLTLSGISLAFNPNVTEYAVNVPNSMTATTVHYTAEDSGAQVSVSGASGWREGANYLIVKVSGGKQYNIVVTRAKAEPATSPAPTPDPTPEPDPTPTPAPDPDPTPEPDPTPVQPEPDIASSSSNASSDAVSSDGASSGDASSRSASSGGASSGKTGSTPPASSQGSAPEPKTSRLLNWLRRDRSAWVIHAAYIGGMAVCALGGCVLGYFIRGRRK